MHLFYSFTALCFLFSLSNCQRASFQPETIDQHYITFGKGGGMANQVSTYYILQNGRAYQHNNLTKEYKSLPRLNKAERKQVFSQAEALPGTAFGSKEPGNIYYFLTIHTDTVRQCTWGRQGFTPADSLTSFYEYLQTLTSESL
ncbi:hypothetical protein [Tunicatimonas pelagia]|uniref:hypothetical protein n=1 Tax=Tunicatimonas pelagia TaxID=931531 RepID=UPI0026670993|nr:hypothetical protein [Tunicatimonas pelagia]WKN42608.1 hypothetical protein P0M28_26580 [Tunicatimonas pelagia]